MIWSFAKVFKKKKVCLMKNGMNNGNQAQNALSVAQHKKSHRLNHEAVNSSGTFENTHTQMQGKWGHKPDWKFEKDFKPLDGLFKKRCLWLHTTSFIWWVLSTRTFFCALFCCARDEENIKPGSNLSALPQLHYNNEQNYWENV